MMRTPPRRCRSVARRAGLPRASPFLQGVSQCGASLNAGCHVFTSVHPPAPPLFSRSQSLRTQTSEAANRGPGHAFYQAASKLSTFRRIAHTWSEKCSLAHTGTRAQLGSPAISADYARTVRIAQSLTWPGFPENVKRDVRKKHASQSDFYRESSKRGKPTQVLPHVPSATLLAKFFTKLSTALRAPRENGETPLGRRFPVSPL